VWVFGAPSTCKQRDSQTVPKHQTPFLPPGMWSEPFIGGRLCTPGLFCWSPVNSALMIVRSAP
jgi:hypothetical protein